MIHSSFEPQEDLDGHYWDCVARRIESGYFLPQAIAELRKTACLDLLRRWYGRQLLSARILKTDTFEEAFSLKSFLFDLARENPKTTGVEISPVIADKARANAKRMRVDCEIVTGDVRSLPFEDGSFDIVVSHSTLDHFPEERDLLQSLWELRRVTAAGGSLVLILDNRSNLFDPLVKLLKWTSPFYIGKSYSMQEMAGLLGALDMEIVDLSYVAHSPRVVDIAVVRGLSLLRSRAINTLTAKMLLAIDRALVDNRIGRLVGTFAAVKAVKRPRT
jgi:SAM-dependent methyltransferase